MKLDWDKLLSRSNLNLFSDAPFLLFERAGFLPEATYRALDENYPKREDCDTKTDVGKFLFNNESKIGKKFLSQNPVWKDFFDQVNSEEFLRAVYRLAKSQQVAARGPLGVLGWTFKKNRLSAAVRFSRRVFIAFEWTYIGQDGEILPHTDSPAYMMSFLMYFPDPGVEFKNCGTKFYFPKTSEKKMRWKRWFGKRVRGNDLPKFYADHEVRELPFQANQFCGFAKSSHSWHSAGPMTVPNGVLRRALVINLYRMGSRRIVPEKISYYATKIFNRLIPSGAEQ